MKRINILCALILLLITSSSAYAGVTDDLVTAYRLSGLHAFVMFTDDPLHDPGSAIAPLGAGVLVGTTCTATGIGLDGLVCHGSSGDHLDDYFCLIDITIVNTSNTTWCLFSENPRTGKKAWAVKYVNGDIPTNDGASIVRCEETDRFDPRYGCQAGPTEISIKGGYINLDTRQGSRPQNADCTEEAHYGRMVVDEVNDTLYICTASGWNTWSSDPP